MHCQSCQHENPAEARFCMQCGHKLGQVCPACQHLLPPEAKFCMACGTPVAQESKVQSPTSKVGNERASGVQSLDPRPRDSRLAATERRQLTVMFCDVVGSTALSTQLDPEEFRAVIRAYQEVCATAIARFEGYLAKYLRDGVLAYFGYPLAHEDDAQRAVRAGLEIISTIQKQVPSPPVGEGQGEGAAVPHGPLQVRIGIHTGLVVVGEMGAGETREPMAIVGETPNIAARFQEIANPNTVVLSAATTN